MSHLSPLTISFSPRDDGGEGEHLRRCGDAASRRLTAAASAAVTTHVPPRWVITFSTSTEREVACSAPQPATIVVEPPGQAHDSSIMSSRSTEHERDAEDDEQADGEEQPAGGATVEALAEEPSRRRGWRCSDRTAARSSAAGRPGRAGPARPNRRRQPQPRRGRPPARRRVSVIGPVGHPTGRVAGRDARSTRRRSRTPRRAARRR